MNENQPFSIITIDPAEVDTGRGAPFRVRRHLPGEPGESESDRILVESIEKCGMMHPPLFVRGLGSATGDPVLLDGYRRVAAAHALGFGEINALLEDVEPEDRGRILFGWLTSFSFGPPLSELEVIIRLEKAYGFDIDAPPAPLPGGAGGRESFERMRRILDLDDAAQEALHRGDVSTGDLLQLIEHPAVDANDAARLLAAERLTRSEQKKAVHLMLRIGDGGANEWRRFVESYAPGGGALLAALELRCHPTYVRDRARIEEIVRDMHLPPGTSIHPPENMEGGSYRLSARIRNEESVTQMLEKLRAAMETGAITKLLEILKGGK